MRRIVLAQAVLIASLSGGVGVGQVLKPRPPAGTQDKNQESTPSPEAARENASPVVVPMTVEAGTPIKVALDSEVRVRKVGQPIHGRTTAPVYAFDKLLIPVGTVVSGKVSAIDAVPRMVRTMQAANGNFSPVRTVHVQFDELTLSDGRRLLLRTVASPAPDGVLRFVSANEKAEQKNKMQDAAAKK